MKRVSVSLLALATVAVASPAVVITEYMYSANFEEFVELTNTGNAAVDLTGWSYDDSSQTPGVFDLTGFGSVAPGESVIFTEADAEAFRTEWSLDATVKILGGVTNDLGRSDEINIYNALDALVDQLTYGDEDFPGTIRAQDHSTALLLG